MTEKPKNIQVGKSNMVHAGADLEFKATLCGSERFRSGGSYLAFSPWPVDCKKCLTKLAEDN